MKKKLLFVALALSSSITLVGCGGGGDDDDKNTGKVTTPTVPVPVPVVTVPAPVVIPPVVTVPAPVVIPPVVTVPVPVVIPPVVTVPTSVFYNVKVIDGYLKNAQVWLDIDGDKQRGDDEPSILSGDGGVAQLDVTNTVNPEKYSAFAKIIFDQTVDEDTGSAANNYVMSAPPGEMEITPLSTLVDIEIAHNTDGSESEEQLAVVKQEAVVKVANDFGIPEDYVLSDFIADSRPNIAYVAENIVSSKILPDDENEFIAVITDDTDDALFNKLTTAVSGMIKSRMAEDTFDIEIAVFDRAADLDSDNDADGVPNALDALPDNADEWLDSDGDNIGNNADPDDDNDNVADIDDKDPLDPEVGEYADCEVRYTSGDASIESFNAQLEACERIPDMDLAGNSILRITGSLQTRSYVFNVDNTAFYYRNGVKYNRIWVINDDDNLELYNGEEQPLNYVMRLVDDSNGNLTFAVYDNGRQSIWSTTYKSVDLSVDILACEDLDSGWDEVNDVPLTYRSLDEFKQVVTSCQDGKLLAAFSDSLIDRGITLTTGDAFNQADDIDTYQFNQDGSGVFTHNNGAGDVSIPMTWMIYEEGIVKVVMEYTDGNDVAQTAHDYLAIVETNGIDFSVKVFSRGTALQGIDDTDLGELGSRVLKVPDVE
ncbi:hypothetical protein HWV03_07225 [Moritella sp. 36]|uniref:hypothetical protein n=1 Tax=Moritella sp. 36 TaxID=2746233 RepID=UPI001BA4402A|nr:hypothetical protein [Moritella sp. 36]QUM88613.1 hypothetical protein HWV03_07225 [Moritella sp. 36]